MKPANLLVLFISLPLLLGGCGGEKEVVNFDLIEKREGIRYLKDSDTPYTGRVIALYDEGQKKFEGTYKNGKHHGLWVHWYKNGQKEEERTYRSGKREGLRVRWHENGQKATEGIYKNDKND